MAQFLQVGHGPKVYGSRPTYTAEPCRWKQPAIGEYKVLTPAEHYNFNERVPFDTNWHRSTALDFLPLSSTLQANSDTFAAPNAVPLDSQYQPLRYESWDPILVTTSFLHNDIKSKQ